MGTTGESAEVNKDAAPSWAELPPLEWDPNVTVRESNSPGDVTDD